MITQNMLKELRAMRRKPKATLELTPNGTVVNQVHRNVDAELERKIAKGENTLQTALENMRKERGRSFNQGLAKAQFNHQNQRGPKL